MKRTKIAVCCLCLLLLTSGAAMADPNTCSHEIIARAQTAIWQDDTRDLGVWYVLGKEGWIPYEGDKNNDGIDDDNGPDCSGLVLKAWQVPGTMEYQRENPSPRYTTAEFWGTNALWSEVQWSAMRAGDTFVWDPDGAGDQGHMFLYHSGDAYNLPLVYEASQSNTQLRHRTKAVSSSYKAKRRSNMVEETGAIRLDNPSATFWKDSTGWNSPVWTRSTSVTGYWGDDYQVIYGPSATEKTLARYTPRFNSSGYYDVYVRFTSASNRATNVWYEVKHRNGTNVIPVNQTVNGGVWVALGRYAFNSGFNISTGSVAVLVKDGTYNANGYVVADAVRFVWYGPL